MNKMKYFLFIKQLNNFARQLSARGIIQCRRLSNLSSCHSPKLKLCSEPWVKISPLRNYFLTHGFKSWLQPEIHILTRIDQVTAMA